MVKTKKYSLFASFAIIAILPTLPTNVNGQIPKNGYLQYFLFYQTSLFYPNLTLISIAKSPFLTIF